LLSIKFDIALENHGRSSAQIVDIIWDAININTKSGEKGWLSISDSPDMDTKKTYDYVYSRRNAPVLLLKNPNIKGRETKVYHANFSKKVNLLKGEETPNIRIIFFFSNGQQITLLPMIKWSGVGDC
jgi:hypothetical protein